MKQGSVHWATWQNLLLAAGVGFLVGASPFTSDELGPSIVAGVLAGAAVLAYRARTTPITEPEPRAQPRPTATLVWLGVSLLLFAAVFAPTFAWLWERWTASIWQNAHGIFVPVVMIFLAHQILRRERDGAEESSAWGFVFLGAGLLLALLDAGARTRYLSALGLVVALPGLSLLFLGARRTRNIAVPLLLGLFMIPIPNAVATHLYLKRATAVGVEPLVELFGISVWREGTLLHLPNDQFVVSDACSGFATLYAAVAVSVVLAWHSRSKLRSLGILAAAWILAPAFNVVRTLMLVVLTHRFGDVIIESPIHEASGVVAFWCILGILFLMADREGLRRAFG
jgi:exosortase